MQIDYTVIRSDRKTLAIQVKADGQVIVRAPRRFAERRIQKFVSEKADWIFQHQQEFRERRQAEGTVEKFSEQELKQLMEKARSVLPEKVRYYANQVGVSYGRITIRKQKTRWGSCSSQGNLNFNCLLMLTPDQVIDSVVVHELCHRKEMNHSEKFYREVYRVFPEYDRWHQWLKKNGSALIHRL